LFTSPITGEPHLNHACGATFCHRGVGEVTAEAAVGPRLATPAETSMATSAESERRDRMDGGLLGCQGTCYGE